MQTITRDTALAEATQVMEELLREHQAASARVNAAQIAYWTGTGTESDLFTAIREADEAEATWMTTGCMHGLALRLLQ